MKFLCPNCGSQDLIVEGSIIEFTSNAWKCLDCGYQGPCITAEKISKKRKIKIRV